MNPDYSPQVRASLVGEEYTFSIRLEEARIIEDKFDMGLLYLEAIFRQTFCKIEHIEAILKFGLMGGGKTEAEAHSIVQKAVRAGWILRYVNLCHEIILAFLGEFEEEEGKDPVGKPEDQSPAPKKTRTRKKATSAKASKSES